MAWHDGGKGGGPGVWDGQRLNVQHLKNIMHDIATAINERQAMLDQTKTQWWIGDGTQKADPALADFEGFSVRPLVPTAIEQINLNILLAQDSITALVALIGAPGSHYARFVDTSVSYIENQSLAFWLAKGSYGNSFLSRDKRLDPKPWQQLQEVLSELIQVTWGLQLSTVRLADGGTSNLEASWDIMRAETDLSAGGPLVLCGPFIGVVPTRATNLRPDTPATLQTSLVQGTLLKGRRGTFFGEAHQDRVVNPISYDGGFSSTIDGTLFTPTSQSATKAIVDEGASWPTTGSDTTIVISTVIPEDPPWSSAVPFPGGWSAVLGAAVVTVESVGMFIWPNFPVGTKVEIEEDDVSTATTDISGLMTIG